MTIPYCTITSGDGIFDLLGITETALQYTKVTFTPNFKNGTVFTFDDALYRPRPTTVTVNTDGQFTVDVLGNSAELGLESPLEYTVSFSDVRVDGFNTVINSWSFIAPDAGTTAALDDLAPVVNSLALGSTRGPRGYRSTLVPITSGPNAGLYQWTDETGQPFGNPVPREIVIPESIAEDAVEEVAPAAVDADLASRDITFTDEGGGEGYFSVGGVPVSGTLVPPAATWSGIAGKPELMTALYTSFPGKSDGAIPSFGDEGVAVTHRGGFGDNLRLVVADGLLQAPDLSGEAGDRGAYWNQPLTGVKRIGATFKLSSGATENGAIAAFVLWSEPIPEPYAVPDSPFHMVIGADYWAFGVYESGSITSISSAYFKYPLADDWNPEVAGSGTEYRFEGWINGDTVTLALPDGSTAVLTDSRIESIAATVACHELYRADGSSGHAAFQRIWADTGEGPVGGASLIDVTRTVRALQAPLPVLGANMISGGSFAVADSYADTTPGEITTDQAYTGTHSWEVTSTGEFQSLQLTRNSSGVAQRVETQPGRIFRWEAQLRKAAGNTGGGNLTLGITAAEEDGTDISSPGLKVIDATSGVSSAAWTTVSGYGTTPADTCFVKLQFALSGAVPADDVFYIDSVILEDVTETFRLNRTNFSATTTSTASLTIDSDTVRRQDVTALATNMTINAPTGTPASGQELTLMIVDDGTPRTLTWNSAWASRVGPLPTATLSGKNIYVQAQWTASIAKWVVLNMSYGPNTVGVKVAVPSTTASAGVLGEWAADASHLYVCTAANTWRRVAVGTW